MKAIVTGGAGFIGSHLVDALLNENIEVTVLDNFSTGRLENLDHVRNRIKLVECDLALNAEWIKHFNNADWVIHLAALADIVPSIQQPEAYFRSNVDGTFNVLQASKKAEVKRFIYIASSSCYGIPDNYPTPESEEIRPQYPYALAKRMGEELVMHWAHVYNFPALSLRFFNVYGAGEPYTIVGDGEQTRDFTFVTDIVKAILTAVKSDRTRQIYNVGSGTTVSVNRLVELLGGKKVHIPKRPGEPDSTFADISKIRLELGWEPQVSIEEGVAEILKHIDYWRNAPVWTPEGIADVTQDWFRYLS